MKNIISLILIVLAILVGLFYIRPLYTEVQALRAEQSQYDQTLANAKQIDGVRSNLLNSYNSLSDTDKTKLALILPSPFDPAKLTSDLAAAAVENGMSLSHMNVQNESQSDSSRSDVTATTTKPYQTYALSFVVTGRYPQFISFLHTIENSAELVDISGLTIAASQSNATPGKVLPASSLDFQVTAETYSQ